MFSLEARRAQRQRDAGPARHGAVQRGALLLADALWVDAHEPAANINMRACELHCEDAHMRTCARTWLTWWCGT